MGSVRSFVVPVGVTAIALASSLAFAQVPASTGAPPPPGGGASTAPAPTASASAAPDKFTTGGGDVGGFTFTDKPAGRRAAAAAAAPSRVVRRGGPLATFPGFEQLNDGGSRLFVQLSQTVPVEQRVAAGSITYVLKGAHLRVHNDTNALVTVHFNTPVFRARLTPSGNDLLFVLELRSAATPTFKVQDNPDHTSTLQIDFAKGEFLGNDTMVAPEERPTTGKRGTRSNGAAPPPSDPPTNAGPTP